MASPLAFRSHQCISCSRRLVSNLESAFQWPRQQQIRGLKKDAKVSTTKVLLLQDITKYGPKGSVVTVPSGTMRNRWYPKKMAEYVTAAKMNELGIKQNAILERDSTFPSRKQRKLNKQQQEAEKLKQGEDQAKQEVASVLKTGPVLDVKQLSPEESTKVLDRLLPPTLEFYRTPVVEAPIDERISPSVPSSSSVSAAARAGKGEKEPAKPSIYGSVSTNDIVANLKAILAEDQKGARVSLTTADISFVEETEEKGRVKHLGEFEIRIQLKEAQDVVRRKIQVHAQG